MEEKQELSLSREDELRFIELLDKFKIPVSSDLFRAIMRAFVSVPVELGVFDTEGRILLIYRKDEDYDGYHSPGTVLRPEENVAEALNRLVKGELQGAAISEPVSLGWLEVQKGTGYGENPTRHEISLLHACTLTGEYTGEGEFFSPDALPELIPHHKVLIPEFAKRFETSLLK